MKNLFTLAVMMAIASESALADGKVAIGGQGGLTFPDFRVKNSTIASQYGSKNGWVAGVFTRWVEFPSRTRSREWAESNFGAERNAKRSEIGLFNSGRQSHLLE